MYFLNINKPKGMTSFDVVRELRKRLKVKQIGHSGTLDPLAQGVLQIAVGKATKLLDYLKSDKKYVADIKFGYVTETFDFEGEKTFVSKPGFSEKKLIETLNEFLGKTLQTPPKYSAIKQNGKKLCDIARKNPEKILEIPQREIEIYSIELISFNGFDEAKISLHCKKGTYVRSLVNDLGQKLGCGAYMSDLTRTCAGNFKIENSNTTEGELIEINPLEALELSKYEVSDDEFLKIKNGNPIPNKTNFDNECEIILTKNNKLVSIAKISDNCVKPKKNFIGE